MEKISYIKCPSCGARLIQLDNLEYRCPSCKNAYSKEEAEGKLAADYEKKLREEFAKAKGELSAMVDDALKEANDEKVAHCRQLLWESMHDEYIDSAKIIGYARALKAYLPDDYFANFCEVANGGNNKAVNEFLNSTTRDDMAEYADIVLDFMIKSAKSSNLTAISLFIERAYKNYPENYDKYTTLYEIEAQKVNQGIYELTMTRDVFLAYSSADIDRVIELCDYLEEQGITCFMALRNLQHGRGAVDNYDQALKTAIDNCKTVVFVSSTNSRSLSCDALTKELPYIKAKDLESAPEYKRDYSQMPFEDMIPRVEYLIEDYIGDVAEYIVKEFFHGLEWCKSKQAVAQRIVKYITEVRETSAQRARREREEYQRQLQEVQRKMEAAANAATQGISGEKAKEQNVKYCKQCKTANKPFAKYCISCGSTEFFASYEEYFASTIKFCADCGTQNKVESKFCESCGGTEFVPTKQDYENLVAERKRQEEERIRREREEERDSAYQDGDRFFKKKQYLQAVDSYNKAIEFGASVPASRIGDCYFGAQDYQNAVKFYLQAEDADARIMYNLGDCYFNGYGVPKDEAKAVEWYFKAAQNGNKVACSILGEYYSKGIGVEKNDAESAKWYLKAAELGDKNVYYILGEYYSKGIGVEKSDAESAKWYQKAAEHGKASACYILGEYYSKGIGVQKDEEKAFDWYLKAAEQGNADAQYIVYQCYKNGNGVQPNAKKAEEWLKKAAAFGLQNAKDDLAELQQEQEIERKKERLRLKKRKRRTRCIIFVSILAVIIVICLAMAAYYFYAPISSVSLNDMEFSKNSDDSYTLTEYTGSDTSVEIPSSVRGVAVTRIGGSAFENCSSLTSITV